MHHTPPKILNAYPEGQPARRVSVLFLHPMASDTLWLPHEYNFRHKDQIQELLYEYGSEGYGLYWVAVEFLFSSNTNTRTITNLSKYLIPFVRSDDKISFTHKFISDCVFTFELFYEKDGLIHTRLHKLKYNGDRLRLSDIVLWKAISKKIFKRDNYTCTYCGKVGGLLECDHIIAISKGGSNADINLTTSCRKCNRQKKDKSVEDFLTWKTLNPDK